ncbi:MmpS family protein [Microbacterium sp. MPKO10]|uniref:MmpS family protein n=1 Tax=Microbacterium sp. MPKO10 TaxID=2989818 RepID=UPI00223693B2|nr:MmpS family protein [Microbacterium sp. MPKO10]MCW4459821.1 MmpS family protein [Microbacterium sp. MPKO10]
MSMPPPQDTQFAQPQSHPTPQKAGNGLGLAAMIVGIVAFVGAFVPFVNYASGFLAFVGLVLGIIALCLKGKRKGAATAGAVISGIALVLSIVMAMVYTSIFATAVSESIEESLTESTSQPAPDSAAEEDEGDDDAQTSDEVIIVYEVTGESTSATISYSTYNDGNFGTEQSTGTELPFTKEVAVTPSGDFDWSSYTLVAMNGIDDEGEITCSITINGEVVSEQTSTGELATATCSSSSFGYD